MITFPCAKINLGLNVVSERADGYHDIESVLYPIPLTDALEMKSMSEKFPSEVGCDLKITGNAIDCDEADNLVVRAYELLAKDFEIPRIHAHLCKRIPSQAGLGGGSADGAFMIRLLDECFRLNLGIAEMERYAARLGSDCPFFITSEPAYATGTGTEIEPADGPKGNLRGYYIVVVKPDVAVSTREAYRLITPKQPRKCCKDVVRQPIDTWRDDMSNDFEGVAIKMHPELGVIKERLYGLGAAYAQMSGSGSAFLGIFKDEPKGVEKAFDGFFTFTSKL